MDMRDFNEKRVYALFLAMTLILSTVFVLLPLNIFPVAANPGVTAEQASNGINLSWTTADFTGATSYVVERYDPVAGAYQQIGIVKTTYYNDTYGDLIPGLQYKYRVTGRNATTNNITSVVSNVVALGSVTDTGSTTSAIISPKYVYKGDTVDLTIEIGNYDYAITSANITIPAGFSEISNGVNPSDVEVEGISGATVTSTGLYPSVQHVNITGFSLAAKAYFKVIIKDLMVPSAAGEYQIKVDLSFSYSGSITPVNPNVTVVSHGYLDVDHQSFTLTQDGVKNLENITVAKYTLEPYFEGFTVSSMNITVQTNATWSPANISEVRIVDESYNVLGKNSSDYSSGEYNITFSTPISIDKDTTKTIYVVLDLGTNITVNQIINVTIVATNDIVAKGATSGISGASVIDTAGYRYSSSAIGESSSNILTHEHGILNLDVIGPTATQKVIVGNTSVVSAEINATASYESIEISWINITVAEVSGATNDSIIGNISAVELWNEALTQKLGTNSSYVSLSGSAVGYNITFTSPYTLETSVNFTVILSIPSGKTLNNSEIKVGFDAAKPSSAEAVGVTSGETITPDVTPGYAEVITVYDSGTLAETLQSTPVTNNVIEIGGNAKIGNVTLTAAREDVKLTSISFDLTGTALPSDISDIKLYNINSSEYLSTSLAWSNKIANLTIADGLTIPKSGNIILDLYVYVGSDAYAQHVIQFSASNLAGVGVTSGNNLASGDLTISGTTSNPMIIGKISASGVSKAPSAATAGQTLEMLDFSLSPTGERADFTSLNVTLTGTANATNVTAIELYWGTTKIGSNSTDIEVGTKIYNITLDAAYSPLTIYSGKTETFTVKIVLNSNSTLVSGTIGVEINQSSDIIIKGGVSDKYLTPSGTFPIASALTSLSGAPSMSYIGGSLAPTVVRNGTEVTFSLDFSKSGVPSLTLSTNSYINITGTNFPNGVVGNLTAETSIAGESVSPVTLSFKATLPANASGTLDVAVYLEGVDGNGASYTQDLGVLPDHLTVDKVAPTIGTPTAPSSVTAGNSVEVSVEVSDNDMVMSVSLYYKLPGETSYEVMGMAYSEGKYVATITASSNTKAGTLEYYIVAYDRVSNSKQSATYEVTVNPAALYSVVVSPSTATVKSGETVTFTAVGYDEYGNTVTLESVAWSVADETIGTISSDGVFTGVKVGTTTVTATGTAGGVSKEGTASVTVEPGALAKLVISPSSWTGKVGETKVFSVAGYDANDNEVTELNVTWSVSPAIGTFNSTTGVSVLFNATEKGTATITVASGTITDTASITIQLVKNPVPASEPELSSTTGQPIVNVTVGKLVVVKANITNDDVVKHQYTYIVQVKDSAGHIVYFGFIQGYIEPGATMTPGISWTPTAAGTYTIEVFVWENFTTMETLSPVQTITLTVSE